MHSPAEPSPEPSSSLPSSPGVHPSVQLTAEPAMHASVTYLLRAEGAVLLGASLAGYHLAGGSWWIFLLCLLLPDLSITAYRAAAAPLAARIYNAAHSTPAPGVLALAGWVLGIPLLWELALVWTAHIGMDRALGFGLKLPQGFRHTHLGRVGRAS